MANQGRERRIEEASEAFARALADSYRIVYEQAAETRQRQEDVTREFYNRAVDHLREQAESNRAAAERLTDQAGAQQEAASALARESAEAYIDFLNDTFARYRDAAESATSEAQRAAGIATGAASNAVDTAAGATRAAAQGASGGPIPGYDEMNADEVAKTLNMLTDSQLREVRDYEKSHKNRATVLGEIDKKLNK